MIMIMNYELWLIFMLSLVLHFFPQKVLSEEGLSLQFLDVVTILLKYCGPHTDEKGETQAVIVDLVATLGFFCANNEVNQVSLILSEIMEFPLQ